MRSHIGQSNANYNDKCTSNHSEKRAIYNMKSAMSHDHKTKPNYSFN